MNKLVKIYQNKWFFQAIGMCFLAMLIVFIGPNIIVYDHAILASWSARCLLILVILLAWLANIVRLERQSKKNNEVMIDGLIDNGEPVEPMTGMDDKFSEALLTLKTQSATKQGKSYLYELPWYIIIGPSGSGKTTALVNSGINFPLEEQFGRYKFKGLSGTKDCDWWFTDEAVLIDTAGRLTSQDHNQDADKQQWQQFMQLLKKHRKKQPINGAIVAVSIEDLITKQSHQLDDCAYQVRLRIDELLRHLDIDFPIYLIFTKCDKILGFNEFFKHYTQQQRQQVWGTTFSYQAGQAFEVDTYRPQFDALINRLHQLQLKHVELADTVAERVNVLSFPEQMMALRPAILMLLDQVFKGNRYHKSAQLRGVYFTCGTQHGTAIDQLVGDISTQLGIAEAHTESASGRSYFLGDLLQDVIFGEAQLAGVDQNHLRKQLWLKTMGYAGLFAGVFGASGYWTYAYQLNREAMQITNQWVQEAQQQNTVSINTTQQIVELLPQLNALEQANQTFATTNHWMHGGIYQGSLVEEHTNDVYLTLLTTHLQPMIMARLKELMWQGMEIGDTALVYTLLKAYLSYTDVADREQDSEAVHNLLAQLSVVDWQNWFSADEVEQLQRHHRYLLNHSHLNYRMDDDDILTVSQARVFLGNLSLAEQVYASLKTDLLHDPQYQLSFEQIAGIHAHKVFSLRDGASVAGLKIAGIYTKKGFFLKFNREYKQYVADYQANSWVLNEDNQVAQIDQSLLKKQVLNLYFNDYIEEWQALLSQLQINQPQQLVAEQEVLNSAVMVNGPIVSLINTLVDQTDLSTPLPTTQQVAKVSEVLGEVSGGAQRQLSRLQRVTNKTKQTDLTPAIAAQVTQHFKAYQQLAQEINNDSHLNQLIFEIKRFVTYIQSSVTSGFSETPALDAVNARYKKQGDDRFSLVIQAANNTSPELRTWVEQLATLGWRVMLKKSHKELDQAWQTQVYPVYLASIANRYPIQFDAKTDILLTDFSRFFGANGVLETFVDRYMLPFVNTSGDRWTSKRLFGEQLFLNNDSLLQLATANKIRQLFFPNNNMDPRINFELSVLTMGNGLSKFSFNYGDTQLDYQYGPINTLSLQWPILSQATTTSYHFVTSGNQQFERSRQGVWALFRLFDGAEARRTIDQSEYHIMITEGQHTAQLKIKVDSVMNPWGERLLQNFYLPKKL